MQPMPPCTSSAHSVSSAAASPLLRRSVTARREGGARRNRAGPRLVLANSREEAAWIASSEPELRGVPRSRHVSASRPFFLLQRVAKLRLESPVFSQRPHQRSPGRCSFRKMLYSGFARAEEPTQFFMYHGGVAVSSAACTLGVADRAPGIKRGTGRANAVVSCACVRILASRRARRR